MLAFAPAISHSQQLEEVFVTANRMTTGVQSTLADVTTIDAETIARSGVSSVNEVLRDLGGVEISQNGGMGSVSGLFVRGTRTSQTLVLVDGVRLENPMSGGGDLEFLPIGAVDRIEIVRGPASTMYGSAAIGGVVQIFTRQQGPGKSAFVSAGGGTQGSWNLQAGGGSSFGADDSTRVSLSAGTERTDGYEATRPYSPNYQADSDGSSRSNVTASLRQLLPRGWLAGVNVLATSGWSKYDDAYSTPQTAKMNYRTGALSGFVSGSPLDGWRTELRAGQTRIDYSFDAFTYAPNTRSTTLSWLNDVKLGPGTLQAGVEQLQQSIDGDGVTNGGYAYVHDSRATDSAFVGYDLRVDRHQLRAQARYDHIESVGSQPTGSLAWGYRLAPTWLARVAVASAFRAPTFDDLYSPFGANPALKPERSRNVEAALEHREATRVLKATAFASRIDDAIELDAKYVPQNLGYARVEGVTFEGRERFGAVGVFGQATFQNPVGEHADPATGAAVTSQLARRARQFASLGADWDLGEWKLGARWIAQGARVDTTGKPMGGYGIVNLVASRRLSKTVDAFARVTNVGDKRYETAWGYNMPPFGAFVGVRWQVM